MVSGGDILAVRPEQQSELYNNIINHRSESAFHDHFTCFESTDETHSFSYDGSESFVQDCHSSERPHLPPEFGRVEVPPVVWGFHKGDKAITPRSGFTYVNRFSVRPTLEDATRFEVRDHKIDFVWTGVVVLYGSPRLVSVYDGELDGKLQDKTGSFTVWDVKDKTVVARDQYFWSKEYDELMKATRSFEPQSLKRCLDGGVCGLLSSSEARETLALAGPGKFEQVLIPVERAYQAALRTAGLIR